MHNSAQNKQEACSGGTLLVTGGSGFLGRAILEELLEDDSPVTFNEIRVFDLVEPPVNHDVRIRYLQGDIRQYEAVRAACQGADVVIHSAAIVDWGTRSEQEILAVNSGGTDNVVRACRECGVSSLVYTSSLDAVYSGKPLRDIDESIEYPERHETVYCRSKYLGEKTVMEADGNGLSTVVLRPSDIYGENDPYHIGSLINMAKGGFYVRLGNGTARSQHVYVYNIAYAHLLAAAALMNGNTAVRGRAYFITDAPGTNFFRFFDQIVTGAGYRIWPRNLWLPRGLAYSMGSISEGVAWLVRPIRRYYPKFSRFAVTYTCTDFTFTSERACNDFGFVPKYSEEEAFHRTVTFYRNQRLGSVATNV